MNPNDGGESRLTEVSTGHRSQVTGHHHTPFDAAFFA